MPAGHAGQGFQTESLPSEQGGETMDCKQAEVADRPREDVLSGPADRWAGRRSHGRTALASQRHGASSPCEWELDAFFDCGGNPACGPLLFRQNKCSLPAA